MEIDFEMSSQKIESPLGKKFKITLNLLGLQGMSSDKASHFYEFSYEVTYNTDTVSKTETSFSKESRYFQLLRFHLAIRSFGGTGELRLTHFHPSSKIAAGCN